MTTQWTKRIIPFVDPRFTSQGPQGPSGPQGPQGPAGPQGEKGDQGESIAIEFSYLGIPIGTPAKVNFQGELVQLTASNDTINVSVANPPTVVPIVLTATEIANKQIILPTTPVYPQAVRIVPGGGPEQFYGVDYVVIENIISWNSMGLDGFLDEGDTLLVRY